MLLGAMALAGIPLMAGYFSKDAIMLGTLGHSIPLYVIGMITALITAIYSFRMIFMTFHGQARDKHLFDHAHESPALMTIPLWILGILSVISGLLNLPFILSLEKWLEPVVGHHTEPPLATEIFALAFSAVIALLGLYIAWSRYLKNSAWARNLQDRFKFLQPALQNSWYFDKFYEKIEWEPLWVAARWFSGFGEKNVIDGAVNGISRGVTRLGEGVRRLQTGHVPVYALSIFIGTTLVVLYFVLYYFVV
jgi:NADH-quinone oxidoreductase subunit L